MDKAQLEISTRISAERPSVELTLEAEMIELDMRRLLATAPAVVGATRALKESTARHDRAAARLKRISLLHQKVEMLADKAQCSLASWSQEHPIRAWFLRRGLRQKPLDVAEQRTRVAAQVMQRVAHQVDRLQQRYAAALAIFDVARRRLDEVRDVEIETLRGRGFVDLSTRVTAAARRARQRECAAFAEAQGIQREGHEISRLVAQERGDCLAQKSARVAQRQSGGQVPRAR